MKVAAWKKYAQVGVLAVSLMGVPLVTPIGAQQQDMPRTDAPRMNVQGENDFPWGLLGLLGLIGLAGLKRRHDVVDRHRVDEPIRR
jgi:MYXO-CTERM domain-containing protein